VVTVQRTIEMIGIATVVITVEPEETAQARPPRALCPAGYPAGHSLAKPNDPELQKRIIVDALALVTGEARPGEVVTRSY
jgi:hypothetical protein